MIHLKPVQGKRVRDPETKKLLGEEGIKLETLSTYWFRRLKDGEVVEVAEAVPSETSQKKNSKDKGV